MLCASTTRACRRRIRQRVLGNMVNLKALFKLYLINVILLTILSLTVVQPSMYKPWKLALIGLLACANLYQVYLVNKHLLNIRYAIIWMIIEFVVSTTLIHHFHTLYKLKRIWPACNTDVLHTLCVLTLSLSASILVGLISYPRGHAVDQINK